MSNVPLVFEQKGGRDGIAKTIACRWEGWNAQRRPKIEEYKELRNYLFATDTSTTSNSGLPWKNTTTIPKLCQIRDNLHSNYVSALFPNDEWLKWDAASSSDNTRKKRIAIEAYMANKCRMGGFRTEASKLLYDYIDFGNAFATVDYEDSYRETEAGEKITVFRGPKIRRLSPLDVVFDLTATSFREAPKIVRAIVSLGELASMARSEPDQRVFEKVMKLRNNACANPSGYGLDDVMDKGEGYQMDGFGSYTEYLQSGQVEVLTYYGDIFDPKNKQIATGRRVIIIDRQWVLENEPFKGWVGNAPIYHVGWRFRPDNLWAMGPLDNLVGMQYRIDHLENLKSDAMDLSIHPPLVISGEVEQFQYGPGVEIHIDENGSITELAKNAQWVIQADNSIAMLEQRMEMYAGAPREAMGIRTAGEKTAFEVQQLQNAAGRIFQEKINQFEVELMEPALNAMLELAARNANNTEVVRTLDRDIGAAVFKTITKEDITANGVLRPIGARHFAAQAQLLQNLTSVFNTPIGQMIAPHTSKLKMAELIEDMLGLNRYELFKPNVAVAEDAETQQTINSAQEMVVGDEMANGAPPTQGPPVQ